MTADNVSQLMPGQARHTKHCPGTGGGSTSRTGTEAALEVTGSPTGSSWLRRWPFRRCRWAWPRGQVPSSGTASWVWASGPTRPAQPGATPTSWTSCTTRGSPGPRPSASILCVLPLCRACPHPAAHLPSQGQNAFHAASGCLILGGLDRARYTGELVALPLVATQDREYRHFTVVLAGMTMQAPGGTNTAVLGGFGVPAVLDSGTTLSQLPHEAVDAVIRALDAVLTDEGILVGCGLLGGAAAAPSFDFWFGGPVGPVIRVPVDELVLDVLKPRIEDGSAPLPDEWPLAASDTCLLGLVPAVEGSPAIIGQTILRSAYVVYDLANRLVAMAQAQFNTNTSDIVEWESHASGSPATSAVTQVVTITQTDTEPTAPPGGIGSSADDDEDWLPPTVTVTSTDGAAEAAGTHTNNAASPATQAFRRVALAIIALTAAHVVLGGLVEWV